MRSRSMEAKRFAEMGSDIVAELQKRFDEGVLAMREGNMARNYAVQGKSEADTASGEMYSKRRENSDEPLYNYTEKEYNNYD